MSVDPRPDRTITARPELLVPAWHLLIAALSWFGLAMNLQQVPRDLVFFTNIAGACCAVGYSVVVVADLLGRTGVVTTLIRGACAMYGFVVTTIFNFLLGADLSTPGSLTLHLIVPLLVLVDWLFVQRREPRLRWWSVALWMVIPLAYLPVYTTHDRPDAPGEPIYDILNPHSANYWPMVAVFFSFFVLVGVVMWLVRRGRRSEPDVGDDVAGEPAELSPAQSSVRVPPGPTSFSDLDGSSQK